VEWLEGVTGEVEVAGLNPSGCEAGVFRVKNHMTCGFWDENGAGMCAFSVGPYGIKKILCCFLTQICDFWKKGFVGVAHFPAAITNRFVRWLANRPYKLSSAAPTNPFV
jgi:hypothetical protein